jgi:hypothetical protein
MDNVFAPISQYAVNPATGNPIPVFCLPGNHDYYSGGGGFYQLLDNLNTSCWGSNSTPQNSPQQAQAASYFCLRSADGGWQFLGMDTAYADHNALAFLKDTFEDTNIMPGLPPNEMDWHTDKLQSFTGKTILLSHHQLYSNNSGIGTPASNQSVNTILFKNFSPYFPNVGVWFWGHEHNLVVFDNVNVTISGMAAPLQLKKGRCVGHGAIPVDKLIENPYANNYPGIPVMPDPADPNTPPQPAYLLGDDGTWYNHGFEILQLHGKGSPINVTYYQVLPATGLPAQIGPGENI